MCSRLEPESPRIQPNLAGRAIRRECANGSSKPRNWRGGLFDRPALQAGGRRFDPRTLHHSAHRPIADPVTRAGPQAGGAVAGVGELTAVEREAAAADALGEPELQALELGDALVDS